MTGRTVLVLLAASLAVLASFGIAAADTTICPTNQSITIGSIYSGSPGDLCAIDGAKECLQEGLQNGKSKLRAFWTFPNVPAGDISINFWGTRAANPDNDNFQFGYNTTGGALYQSISGALISKPFAPSGGVTIPLFHTTQTTTFYVALWDTDNSGSSLDTVCLDDVVIISH